MRNLFATVVFTLPLLLSAAPAFAQSSDELKALGKEIEALKEGQAKIHKDVQDIKKLLETRGAAPAPGAQTLVLAMGKNPFKGEKSAKLVLIDFTDYQ